MPLKTVRYKNGKIKGYKWGDSGKLYKDKDDALKQGKAIEASKERQRKKKKDKE